jgi:hypothetical protein
MQPADIPVNNPLYAAIGTVTIAAILPDTSCRQALLEAIHPKHNHTQPFYSQLSEAQGRDVPVAESTIQKVMPFDGCEDVLVGAR